METAVALARSNATCPLITLALPPQFLPIHVVLFDISKLELTVVQKPAAMWLQSKPVVQLLTTTRQTVWSSH
jgi:hypothetical protein